MEYVIIGIIVLALILLFANVRVVPQATEYVIEFLGKYKTTCGGESSTCSFKVIFLAIVSIIGTLTCR